MFSDIRRMNRYRSPIFGHFGARGKTDRGRGADATRNNHHHQAHVSNPIVERAVQEKQLMQLPSTDALIETADSRLFADRLALPMHHWKVADSHIQTCGRTRTDSASLRCPVISSTFE